MLRQRGRAASKVVHSLLGCNVHACDMAANHLLPQADAQGSTMTPATTTAPGTPAARDVDTTALAVAMARAKGVTTTAPTLAQVPQCSVTGCATRLNRSWSWQQAAAFHELQATP